MKNQKGQALIEFLFGFLTLSLGLSVLAYYLYLIFSGFFIRMELSNLMICQSTQTFQTCQLDFRSQIKKTLPLTEILDLQKAKSGNKVQIKLKYSQSRIGKENAETIWVEKYF